MSRSTPEAPFWRRVLRAALPKSVRRDLRRAFFHRVYVGDYENWAVARAAADGYDHPTIFERTLAAARQVRDGHAAWERDTALFQTPERNEALYAALRHAAGAAGDRLNLVDFGGAFGSTWWQHRAWLQDLGAVRWSIVEQPPVVAAGQREFSAGPLRFYDSLSGCLAAERPSVILLSSVLPYLEHPHDLLAQVAAGPFQHAIIDRTGFVSRGRDRLTVQHVPPRIYPGSYPCWFFDRAKLLRPFGAGWRVRAEWATLDEIDIAGEACGLLLERISPAPGGPPLRAS